MPKTFEFSTASGYPDRHAQVLQEVIRSSLIQVGVTSFLALAATLGTLFGHFPPVLTAATWAIFLTFGLLSGLGGMYDIWRHVRVIPYFQRKVGEIDTFLKGESIARTMKSLDRLAESISVPPLSTFGFNDDLYGEQLVWHPAAEGLKTVSALLREIDIISPRDQKLEALLDDLVTLEQALQRAADQEIPFCLLLRHGNSTSGHEWDVRQGTAF